MLSRVAESLYWMSRYLERVEHTARLVDANVVLALDQAPAFAEQRWARLLASLHAIPPEGPIGARSMTDALTFDRSNKASIITSLGAARDNARQVREQISSEMWEQINRLFLQVSQIGIDDIWNMQPHAFFRDVKEGAHLFQGLTDATMNQGEGWHFMELGRFIERASATVALLDAQFAHYNTAEDGVERPQAMNQYLDWVGFLKSRTAFEAYCQVYTADLQPERIAEFLLLNPEFPHSLRFAAGRINSALQAIMRVTASRRSGQAERLAGRLRATLEYAQIDEILSDDIQAYLADMQEQCAQIHRTIHEVYFAPPLAAVLN